MNEKAPLPSGLLISIPMADVCIQSRILGMHHDLMDVSEPAITGINDWVSGYTVQGLLNSYAPAVATVAALRNSILSNNGFRQQAEVEHVVIGYGW